MSSRASLFDAQNLYWPRERSGEPFSSKKTAHFAAAIRDSTNDHYHTIETIGQFLKESLALNRNVVLSSEEFDTESVTSIHRLATMLQGFEVTIVYVYRELLSHMVSLYFELNRFEHDFVHFTEPFSAFLLKSLDYVSPILDPIPLLRDYGTVFGRNNLTIIDLAGCGGANPDITYVLVCEVAGVLCDQPELFSNADLGSNAAYSLVPAEVFSFYNTFVESQHGGSCKHCGSLFAAYEHFAKRFKSDLTQRRTPALPLIRSHLDMLVPFAERMDTALRTQYGDRILHGNATASLLDMRQHVRVESLDIAAFLQSAEWGRWMRTTFESAKAEGRLCGCAK